MAEVSFTTPALLAHLAAASMSCVYALHWRLPALSLLPLEPSGSLGFYLCSWAVPLRGPLWERYTVVLALPPCKSRNATQSCGLFGSTTAGAFAERTWGNLRALPDQCWSEKLPVGQQSSGSRGQQPAGSALSGSTTAGAFAERSSCWPGWQAAAGLPAFGGWQPSPSGGLGLYPICPAFMGTRPL